MNLKEIIGTGEIEKTLSYTRKGVLVEAFPKNDCTIENGIDEIIQLQKVSGSYYFYGQILGEVTEALNDHKVGLKTRKSAVFLKNQVELQQKKARVTDKVLENLVNVDTEVVQFQKSIAVLEGAEKKLETILTALKLKEDSLIETSRRSKKEIRAINNLT